LPQTATLGMNVAKEYYNFKSHLSLPDMCIYCVSEDDELVLDTERSSKGKIIRPQYQSCAEYGKSRVAYGKHALYEGTGGNVRQRDSYGVGYHDDEDKCDINTNDNKEEENDDDDNDNGDGECAEIKNLNTVVQT
jgi:hypothetical protein